MGEKIAIVVLILLIHLAAACGDDDGASPTSPTTPATSTPPTQISSATPTSVAPTATNAAPTSTPTGLPVGPDEPGEAGFRTFLRRLDGGLEAQGGLAIKARWRTIEVICTEEDLPERRSDGAVCDAAGQTYDGVKAGNWRSQWQVLPVETVNERLDEVSANTRPDSADRFGDGALHVRATSISEPVFKTVVSAIVATASNSTGTEARVVWLVSWEFSEGEWKAIDILFAKGPLVDEALDEPPPDLQGLLPNWERYP